MAAPVRDYDAHIAALRGKLPGPGFHIVVEKPFVVIGDERPARVRQRARDTVRWAVTMLKKAYFTRDPDRILDIWLFKDRLSYEANARKLFGGKPSTPFGYYSPRHGALVMNIATGGGTLVHEIVHPFVHANFPSCPAWFNEGLGSLYEQSGERNKQIVGFTNWRLAGLQRAIRADTVPSFETLLTTSEDAFYNADPGTNYAQARYLCYWLQEHRKLRTFYRRFHAARRKDRTGLATLRAVLETKDLGAFKKEWEAWVLALRFDR